MTDPHTPAIAPFPQSTDDALPFEPGDHWADHVADYNSVTFRPHPDFTGWDEVVPIASEAEGFSQEDEFGGGAPLHQVSAGTPPPSGAELSDAAPLHHASHGLPPCSGENIASPPTAFPEKEGTGSLACTRATARQATSRTAFQAAPPEDDDPLLAFAPYMHKQPRSNSITPDKQRAFIATLAATGIVKQAARRIGKSLEALYKLRAQPGAEGFAAAWDAAIERGVTRLEDCALERAMQGTPTPIVGREGILGWWDKPDNGLLRFLLQYRMADKYGVQRLQPGNAIYESIKKQVLEEFIAAQNAHEEARFEKNLEAFEDSVRKFFKSRSAKRLQLEREGDAEARIELGLPLLPEEEPKSYASFWPGAPSD